VVECPPSVVELVETTRLVTGGTSRAGGFRPDRPVDRQDEEQGRRHHCGGAGGDERSATSWHQVPRSSLL
jgi:hypothetical protein